jgi:hypothetical protein
MKAVVLFAVIMAIPVNLSMAQRHTETYCRVDNSVRELVGETYVSPYCD